MTWIRWTSPSRLGGEVVRLWVASVDFREDVVGSEALMLRVAENYRKIRNTFRYILGNLVRLRSAERMRFRSRRWKRSTSTCCARPGRSRRDVQSCV